MSYQIGQIVKSNANTYMEEKYWHVPTGDDMLRTAGFGDRIFMDYSIELNQGLFQANETYYIRFTIKRILNQGDPRFSNITQRYSSASSADDPRAMNIKLELFKNSGNQTKGVHQLGTYQVIQSNLLVEPYIEGFNTEYASFEVIFTPNDNYRFLGFVLSRVNYDYYNPTQSPPRDDVRSGITFEDGKGDFCVIKDILPKGTNNYVDKIGIQTRPGALVCINREPFRVGRSGTLEINNGVPISFFGIVAPNGSNASNIDKFILDYAWNQ